MAAEIEAQVDEALKKIKVTFEPLPVLNDPEAALASDAIRVLSNRDNLCFEQPQIKGDAEVALKQPKKIKAAMAKAKAIYDCPEESIKFA